MEKPLNPEKTTSSVISVFLSIHVFSALDIEPPGSTAEYYNLGNDGYQL